MFCLIWATIGVYFAQKIEQNERENAQNQSKTIDRMSQKVQRLECQKVQEEELRQAEIKWSQIEKRVEVDVSVVIDV